MMNALKMDLYRLFKTKSLYVIWLFYTIITMMGIYILFGIGDVDSHITITVLNMMSDTSIFQLSLFIAIFTVLYTTADRKSGYIKNIAGQVPVRSSLILSKSICLLLYTILSFGWSIVVYTIALGLFVGDMKLGPVKDFLCFIGVQILLHYAMALIAMLVAVVITSDLVGMIIAVIIGAKMTEMFYGSINTLFGNDFDISRYTLVGQMLSVELDHVGSAAGHAVLVGCCFAVGAMVISCLVFEKRDIV